MEQSFNIKSENTVEFKSYLKNNLPSLRFIGNPYYIGDKLYCYISIDVEDSNKLNILLNKYYEEKPVIIKKSIWSKFLNIFK